MKFIFNDYGVCVNPDIVYHFQINGDLTWRYIEISICEDEKGKWDYGYNSLASSSPACLNGLFDTRVEAIEHAISEVKKHFTNRSEFFGNHAKHERHFCDWLSSRRQLSMF
jgi:hypothetical protein